MEVGGRREEGEGMREGRGAGGRRTTDDFSTELITLAFCFLHLSLLFSLQPSLREGCPVVLHHRQAVRSVEGCRRPSQNTN